jgi:intraflagellar transport protein 52
MCDQCALNKDEIKYEKIKNADILIFAAPTKRFKKAEFDALQKYLEDGKHIFYMADEGGENKIDTNFNFLLENYNMLANNDTVIRTAYFKYFHPKEVFVQNGVCDDDFIRLVNKEEKRAGLGRNKRLALAFDNDGDDTADTGLGGYHFVYPFGCSLAVKAPSVPLLTSGPISYPVNQPVCAYYQSKNKGVLLVIGSYRFLTDDYIDKEENAKMVVGLRLDL